MSIWEQRRKEREQQKQTVSNAPTSQSKNVKQFPQPKAGPTIAKGNVPKPQTSQIAPPNIVSTSAIKNLVAKPISDEYGGAMNLQDMQNEKLSFSQFQEQKNDVQRQMTQQGYQNQQQGQQQQQQQHCQQPITQQFEDPRAQQIDKMNQLGNKEFNIGGNEQPRRQHIQADEPQQLNQISTRQQQIDKMNQGQQQGFSMPGERSQQQRLPQQIQQSPQQGYPQQEHHAGPKMVQQRAKKPSEMSKQEYEEYEAQLQKKHHYTLIQKVLYDKSVTTFDKMDCEGLRKVDKEFARLYDAEFNKKEAVLREQQIEIDEQNRKKEYEKQQDLFLQQQQSQQISYQQPQYATKQQTFSPPQAEFDHYQRAYQNQNQFSTAPPPQQIQHELDDLRKEVIMLRQKLQNAEYSVGKYEKQITELSNELQDERHQRIQANKAVDDAQRDMVILRDELQTFQLQVQQFQKIDSEQQKMQKVIDFAQESYKPSEKKLTVADKLLSNANAVLDKYQDLGGTFKETTSLKAEFHTIHADEDSPLPVSRYNYQQTIETKNSVIPSSQNMLRNDNDLMSTDEMNLPPVSIPMAIMDNIHDVESRETNGRDIRSQQSMFNTNNLNSMLPSSNYNSEDVVRKYAGLPRPSSGQK
ncbi:hypothetical protein SS50377_22052 [Spironucleus salmonicida]|uniref:Uncharacterized protein n=1 Tax=Spironucleus salmonicida TaxID=348837 RepID=V6LYA8_9EUKA|nr:hypothetical protein SS50377_22052 [Spironucleus salmonicida]|eukprot:EST45784.1 Hypothetical protein SS50377_14357 [Spironucleus salmonicida]